VGGEGAGMSALFRDLCDTMQCGCVSGRQA
jgi:hypothetical protein